MGIHNNVMRNDSKERYRTAMKIRNILSDGRTRTIAEIAGEMEVPYNKVCNALPALTGMEPMLAEEDDDSLFIVTGG